MNGSTTPLERLEALLASGGAGDFVCLLALDSLEHLVIAGGETAVQRMQAHVLVMLQAACGPGCVVPRDRSGQFLVMLTGLTPEGCRQTVARLLAAVPDCRLQDGRDCLAVTARAGAVPLSLVHPRTLERLIQMAEATCAAARTCPGAQAVYSDEPGAVALAVERTATLICDLPSAMRENRMRLYAQEISNLRLNPSRVQEVEVFVHMIDRQGAEHPPATFIPVAERTNLIEMLDRWVLRETLVGHAAALRQVPDLRLSLNVSGRSVGNADLWPFLRDVLAESGVAPQRIQIEITETSAISDIEAARRNIRDARIAGCRVALDDFGAGLSGMIYLKTFELDTLKIDGALIGNVAIESHPEAEIVRSVIALGRRLGLMIVAEHVDRHETLAALRRMGVDRVQGFLIGTPRPFADVLVGLQQ